VQATAANPYIDWDDSMKNIKYVTKTEYEWLLKKKAEEEAKRREEEALAVAAAASKKAPKKDAKKKVDEPPKEERPPLPQPGERADIAYDEPILEPENTIVDKTEKNVILKASAVSDYAKYEVSSREIFFKPTLMYTSRSH
jgi:hydrocephalus-inducing protein